MFAKERTKHRGHSQRTCCSLNRRRHNHAVCIESDVHEQWHVPSWSHRHTEAGILELRTFSIKYLPLNWKNTSCVRVCCYFVSLFLLWVQNRSRWECNACRSHSAHKNAACRLNSAFSHCMAAAAATLVVLAVVAMTNGVQTASEFPTTSNHTEQCRYQIDCGESGYAPILAFCVIRHATTHVRQNAI